LKKSIKIFAIAICAAMLLAACGGENAQSISSDSSVSENSSSVASEPEVNEPEADEPESEANEPEPDSEAPGETDTNITESESPPSSEVPSSSSNVASSIPASVSEAPSASSSSSSSSEAEKPASESSASSEPAVASSSLITTSTGETYDLYLYYPEEAAYYMLGAYFHTPRETPDHPVTEMLNELPNLPAGEKKPDDKVQSGVLVVREGYTKTEINLLSDTLEVNGNVYALTPTQYSDLKNMIDSEKPKDNVPSYSARWLVWMNPGRVTKIECIDDSGKKLTLPTETLLLASMETAYINVNNAKTYIRGNKNFSAMKGAYQTFLTFDNGVVYTIVLSGDSMFVESSDMNTAYEYKVHSDALAYYKQNMIMAEQGALNPRTAKPVIYLYPEKTQDVDVSLSFNGIIDYTYPTYNNGWRVTAQPDGTLTNKSDSSTHYYLFWDGTSNFRSWDFSEGFVVKGSEIESFFKEKLPALGLTPREYNDFITYWVPEMSKNAYNLVTFSTTEYEAIAPLSISPAPDTVLRVHMVYKAIPAPVDVKEQILPTAPARNGFTVVEWGGTRA